MILLIDNYDSFAHNLARYLIQLGQPVTVVRNDAITVRQVLRLSPRAVVLSPGPCTPDEAGVSLDLVRQLHSHLPLLGVCLGHQTIAQALGAIVAPAPQPCHGKTSLIHHDARCEFHSLPNPFPAARYHSLHVPRSSLPPTLEITAWTEDQIVMAVRHRTLPVTGWQFHPESILTAVGYQLLAQWLATVGLPVSGPIPRWSDELASDAVGDDRGGARWWEVRGNEGPDRVETE